MRIIMVRHAAVDFAPGRPSRDWHLSMEGRAEATRLAGDSIWEGAEALYVSPEPKAMGTAQRIAAPRGMRIVLEQDLREVERPWVGEGSYREVAASYLRGESVPQWEPRQVAQTRIRTAVDGLRGSESDVVIVSHGLLLSLLTETWIDEEIDQLVSRWERMRFPDLAVIDTSSSSFVRAFGDSLPGHD
jgi:probable phosphoglycerate mutase